jgi:hypothetical protein
MSSFRRMFMGVGGVIAGGYCVYAIIAALVSGEIVALRKHGPSVTHHRASESNSYWIDIAFYVAGVGLSFAASRKALRESL